MICKRRIAESLVWGASCLARNAAARPLQPRSIFVLRNNDIGDLLVVTPLFDALHRRFPGAAIVAGIGAWNVDVLRGNPHVAETVVVNAPWHNRVTGTRDPVAACRYITSSDEIGELRRRRFDIGIDVLGSPWGSLLLMRLGIPWRLGVRGYAGGHSGVQQHVDYDANAHVGRAALRFAELLGAGDLPGIRPQIFLDEAEIADAERVWRSSAAVDIRRITIAPGGGHPGRAWPVDHFVELTAKLVKVPGSCVTVVGAAADVGAGARVASSGALDLTGRLSLRQSLALISRADLVVSNSSMAMHAAAAFDVPAIVLLGEAYPSASAHATQWGHGLHSRVLGRDAGHDRIFDPAEVLPLTLNPQRPFVTARVGAGRR
jgi:ADP-heptose:LPS heptosyltransferase